MLISKKQYETGVALFFRLMNEQKSDNQKLSLVGKMYAITYIFIRED